MNHYIRLGGTFLTNTRFHIAEEEDYKASEIK
jgi:hypothetical protein